MKRRKLISSLLALALTLALAVPAFAAGETLNGTKNSTEITIGTILNVPEIKVTIAPLPSMVINPYKLAYTGTASVPSGSDSLISAPALITNESGVGIKITAKPYISKTSSVNIVETKSAAEAEGLTQPTAYMGFMFASAVTDTTDLTDSTKVTWPADADATALKSSTTADGVASIDLTLAKPTSPATATYGAYKIIGATGGKTWTDENKFEVKILFDIAPVIGG